MDTTDPDRPTAPARRRSGRERVVASMARSRRVRPLCALLGVLAVVAVVAVVAAPWAGRDQPGSTSPGPVPTTVAPAIVAKPRPEVLPEPVAASGACGDTLGRLRQLMEDFASGASLDHQASATLTTLLAEATAACDAGTKAEFMAVELTPWLTYLVPEADRPAPLDPAAPTTTTPAPPATTPATTMPPSRRR